MPLVIALIALTSCLNQGARTTAERGQGEAPPRSPSPSPTSVRGLEVAGFEITRQGERIVQLTVEIADTPAAQARGLMGVEKLDTERGMVFLFGAESRGPFYMKDTLIPLDIAFWDQSGKVVDVLQMEPCRADPCKLYYSRSPYLGAIEANLNALVGKGVAPGDDTKLAR